MILYFLILILICEYTTIDIDLGDVDLSNNVLKFGYGINYKTWERYHTHLADFI